MIKIFPKPLRAVFLNRPNRFITECLLNEEKVIAYLPNPGKLWELLFPGAVVFLTENSKGKTDYTMIGVMSNDIPVMLHTHHTNSAVQKLLEKNLIPEYEDCTIVKREAIFGNSRFDFLLEKNGRQTVLEVKSCTLFHGKLAMFPDALSERASKHLRKLALLAEAGYSSSVLIVCHSKDTKYFLPEFHTDPLFASTLYNVRSKVNVSVIGVSWNESLELSEKVRQLSIPWHIYGQHSNDSGCYMIVLEMEDDKTVAVGKLGQLSFKKGFYCYAGSALKKLSKRVARHQRKRKRMHWHIDYLRKYCSFRAAIPIRTTDKIECTIADKLKNISDDNVHRFGCSDCRCDSHLFYFNSNPIKSKEFVDVIMSFRMGKLVKKI